MVIAARTLWTKTQDEPFAGGTQPRRDCSWWYRRRYPTASTVADSIRARQRCEIFATLRVFLNRVTVVHAFSAVMSLNHNEWGSYANGAASMHQSAWVVFFLLMFGEIAVLAVAGFILWIMGEFGEDTPR
jgi:hypothetical protein